MRLTIRGSLLIAAQLSKDEYEIIRSWNMMRWDRSLSAMVGRIGLDLLNKLRMFGLPDELEARRREIEQLEHRTAAAKNEKHPKPLIDYPVKPAMFEHQIRGANCAVLTFGYVPENDEFKETAHHGYGFLFEIGCGKTLTAMAVTGALWKYGKAKKVLVVAPASVCGVWIKDLAEQADFPVETALMFGEKAKRLNALQRLQESRSEALKVAVINYESTWRDGLYEALRGWDPDVIIADESQRIKSHDAAQSKAMHKLGDAARFRLILSGTPIQNNAIDIFSQYRFLDPGVFGTNFYAFRNRYAILGGFNKKQIVGYRDLDELVRKEHSIAYRVTKAEALDLPEQTFENRYIQLEPPVRRLYDQIKRESYAELETGDSITAGTVLTKLLRLQQLTGGFLRTDESEQPKEIHTQKLQALMEIVEDCVDAQQKLVIFARFTAEIDLIAEAFRKKGIRASVMDGRTPTEHKTDQLGREHMSRAELVQDFQTNPETVAFIAQIQTAGLGITLHAASLAVYYSLDFNYGSYEQSTGRIHRIGQKHPCTYIHLIAEKTVDEKVMKALAAKNDIAKDLVDNWRQYFE